MLTSNLKLPPQKVPARKKWTGTVSLARQAANTFIKASNPLLIILIIMAGLTVIGELSGRHFSWGWYIFLILLLVAHVILSIETNPNTHE